MEIWSDRQNFLNQIIELQNKNENKNDKTNVQDEEDLNVKDSNKIIKNKRIHARSIKQLDKLEGFDKTDDNLDNIIDKNVSRKSSHRKSSSRNSTRRGQSDDEEGNVGELENGSSYRSDLLKNDEIADRLERQMKEQTELKEKAEQLLKAKTDVEDA
jgi:hypothetical protein